MADERHETRETIDMRRETRDERHERQCNQSNENYIKSANRRSGKWFVVGHVVVAVVVWCGAL